MRLFRRNKSTPPSAAEPTPKSQSSSPKRRPLLPLEIKLLALDALQQGLTRSEVAEIVGVATVTISAWQKKYDTEGIAGFYRRPSTPKARSRCRALEERIVARRQEHPGRGVRRIRDELRREEGLAVSAEKVRTVLDDAGLNNPPVKPHKRAAQPRRFERSLPNALWQIDIFTFELKRMYRVYLVGIIDDHSRHIVGWGLFRRQTADAVLEVVKGAIGQWGAPREILSDNGRQFVAWRGKTRFQKVLKQQGIGHVRSAPHHPMTLGKIERFWQSIWREFLSEAVFASFADACQRLDHWVQYYNHQRPHQGIDGACPADRFYGVADDVAEAVKQGCKENALKLALGQQTQRPLYLLGQLGDTDVRVVRRGEQLEVKVGETVREVIRLGAPYEIGEDGHGRRDASEMAEPERAGAAAPDRPGATGTAESGGTMPDVWDEPSDPAPGSEGNGAGGGGSAGAETPRSQASADQRDRSAAAQEEADAPGARTGPPAAEVRGDPDASGTGAEAGPGRAVAGRKKTPKGPITGVHPGYVGRYSMWVESDDGERE